jgi:hypothetical protein
MVLTYDNRTSACNLDPIKYETLPDTLDTGQGSLER